MDTNLTRQHHAVTHDCTQTRSGNTMRSHMVGHEPNSVTQSGHTISAPHMIGHEPNSVTPGWLAGWPSVGHPPGDPICRTSAADPPPIRRPSRPRPGRRATQRQPHTRGLSGKHIEAVGPWSRQEMVRGGLWVPFWDLWGPPGIIFGSPRGLGEASRGLWLPFAASGDFWNIFRCSAMCQF